MTKNKFFILILFIGVLLNFGFSENKGLIKELNQYKYLLLIQSESKSNFNLTNDYLLVGKPVSITVYTNSRKQFTLEVLCRNKEILNFNANNIELPIKVKNNDLYFVYSYQYNLKDVTKDISDSIRLIEKYKPYIIVIGNIEFMDKYKNTYKSVLYINKKLVLTETNVVLIDQ